MKNDIYSQNPTLIVSGFIDTPFPLNWDLRSVKKWSFLSTEFRAKPCFSLDLDKVYILCQEYQVYWCNKTYRKPFQLWRNWRAWRWYWMRDLWKASLLLVRLFQSSAKEMRSSLEAAFDVFTWWTYVLDNQKKVWYPYYFLSCISEGKCHFHNCRIATSWRHLIANRSYNFTHN